MVKRSKRYKQAAAAVDPSRVYEITEALEMLKSLPKVKFDETVEVAVRLGIDPRKSDQLVRGAVSLPKGLGKNVRIAVFAEGDKAEAAKAAGADTVGSDDLAKRIEDGWMDFDVVIASPDMMKHVGRLGKVLGPQGKMPSPKSGTVTPDVAQAVTDFKAGKVEFRTDSGGNVHAPVGKRSFPTEDLAANLTAFLDHLVAMRPAVVKGIFVRRVCVSTTMSPGAIVQYGA
ncbi:MAG: 50S ribosomal protein L1 [Planctomycetes bacterium]|mgnify:CR=1 FL=1|nr:50S ribosomal protein L1 [Planctomycetota bacterium]MCB9910353.1 50S ribosomal protein L1 [Planctomycetota bacterium]MCB9912036.1 50S ribosomal protein L1 [Planctomycetota bacterium]HPF14573.1 50S ribosomal protein L1 [Planctomycetota bacterium]HRV81021.1 50S ribosomal protein L1 [Planctomycetota bacterium]